MNDDGQCAERHQDDADHAHHQQTGVEATGPPRLHQLVLPVSLGNVLRVLSPPGEVLVAVVGVAAAEEKLGVFDVLQTGGVVNTGGTTDWAGGQAGH